MRNQTIVPLSNTNGRGGSATWILGFREMMARGAFRTFRAPHNRAPRGIEFFAGIERLQGEMAVNEAAIEARRVLRDRALTKWIEEWREIPSAQTSPSSTPDVATSATLRGKVRGPKGLRAHARRMSNLAGGFQSPRKGGRVKKEVLSRASFLEGWKALQDMLRACPGAITSFSGFYVFNSIPTGAARLERLALTAGQTILFGALLSASALAGSVGAKGDGIVIPVEGGATNSTPDKEERMGVSDASAKLRADLERLDYRIEAIKLRQVPNLRLPNVAVDRPSDVLTLGEANYSLTRVLAATGVSTVVFKDDVEVKSEEMLSIQRAMAYKGLSVSTPMGLAAAKFFEVEPIDGIQQLAKKLTGLGFSPVTVTNSYELNAVLNGRVVHFRWDMEAKTWQMGRTKDKLVAIKSGIIGIWNDGAQLKYEPVGIFTSEMILAMVIAIANDVEGESPNDIINGLEASMEPNSYRKEMMNAMGVQGARHQLGELNLTLNESGKFKVTSKGTEAAFAAAWATRRLGEPVIQTEDNKLLVVRDGVFGIKIDGDTVTTAGSWKHCFKSTVVNRVKFEDGKETRTARVMFVPFCDFGADGTIVANDAGLAKLHHVRGATVGGAIRADVNDSRRLGKLNDKTVAGKAPSRAMDKWAKTLVTRINENLVWHVSVGDRIEAGTVIATMPELVSANGTVIAAGGSITFDDARCEYAIVKELIVAMEAGDRFDIINVNAKLEVHEMGTAKVRIFGKGMVVGCDVAGKSWTGSADFLVTLGVIKNTVTAMDAIDWSSAVMETVTIVETVHADDWEARTIKVLRDLKARGLDSEDGDSFVAVDCVVVFDHDAKTITYTGEVGVMDVELTVESTTVAQACGNARTTLPSANLFAALGGDPDACQLELVKKRLSGMAYTHAIAGRTPAMVGHVVDLHAADWDGFEQKSWVMGDVELLNAVMAHFEAKGLTLQANDSVLALFKAGGTKEFKRLLSPDALGINYIGYGSAVAGLIRMSLARFVEPTAQYEAKLKSARALIAEHAWSESTMNLWGERYGFGAKVQLSSIVGADEFAIARDGYWAKTWAAKFNCSVDELDGKKFYGLRVPMALGAVLTLRLLPVGVKGSAYTFVVNAMSWRAWSSGDGDGDTLNVFRIQNQVAKVLKKNLIAMGAMDPFVRVLGLSAMDEAVGMAGEVNDCANVLAMINKVKEVDLLTFHRNNNEATKTGGRYRGTMYRMLEATSFAYSLGLIDSNALHFAAWMYEHRGNAVKPLAATDEVFVTNWTSGETAYMESLITNVLKNAGSKMDHMMGDMVAGMELASVLNLMTGKVRRSDDGSIRLSTRKLSDVSYRGVVLTDKLVNTLIATMYRINWYLGSKKLLVALDDMAYWAANRAVLRAAATKIGIQDNPIFRMIDTISISMAAVDRNYSILAAQ